VALPARRHLPAMTTGGRAVEEAEDVSALAPGPDQRLTGSTLGRVDQGHRFRSRRSLRMVSRPQSVLGAAGGNRRKCLPDRAGYGLGLDDRSASLVIGADYVQLFMDAWSSPRVLAETVSWTWRRPGAQEKSTQKRWPAKLSGGCRPRRRGTTIADTGVEQRPGNASGMYVVSLFMAGGEMFIFVADPGVGPRDSQCGHEDGPGKKCTKMTSSPPGERVGRAAHGRRSSLPNREASLMGRVAFLAVGGT